MDTCDFAVCLLTALFSDAVEAAYTKSDAFLPPCISQKAYCALVTNGNAIWHGLSAVPFPGSIW